MREAGLLVSMGSRGEEWSNIVGLVGPGVTGVEGRLDNGRVVQASVKAGWWAAWWPGPEGGGSKKSMSRPHCPERSGMEVSAAMAAVTNAAAEERSAIAPTENRRR